MDVAIILVLVVVVALFYKDVKTVVYFFGITEIFFRTVHFINSHINVPDINRIINKYIPSSLFSMMGKYVNGIVYEILMWVLVIVFIIFEGYLIKYFFKKKKR